MKNNIKILLAILCLFLFACVLPGLSSPLPVLATPLATSTNITDESNFSCASPEIASLGKRMVIDAKPIGLNIRERPEGNVLATAPDGETVQVILFETGDGWAKVRWEKSDGNFICGFAKNEYLIIQEE